MAGSYLPLTTPFIPKQTGKAINSPSPTHNPATHYLHTSTSKTKKQREETKQQTLNTNRARNKRAKHTEEEKKIEQKERSSPALDPVSRRFPVRAVHSNWRLFLRRRRPDSLRRCFALPLDDPPDPTRPAADSCTFRASQSPPPLQLSRRPLLGRRRPLPRPPRSIPSRLDDLRSPSRSSSPFAVSGTCFLPFVYFLFIIFLGGGLLLVLVKA